MTARLWTRRLIIILAALGLIVAAGGCGNKRAALGAGDDVNVCDGIILLDGLDEPSPDDRLEVRNYAEAGARILDRVDPKITFQDANDRKQRPSAAILKDLKLMQRRFENLAETVKTAEAPAAVRSAVNRFSEDAAYQAADARAVRYFLEICGGIKDS